MALAVRPRPRTPRFTTILPMAEGDWNNAMSKLIVADPAHRSARGNVEVVTEASRGTESRSPAHLGNQALGFVTSMVRRLLRQIRQTYRATCERPVRFVAHVKVRWRRRSLNRAFAMAQLALGQRMFAAGIDDGELGAQISALNEKIRESEAAKTSCPALKAEREKLVLQLAAAALLEKGPLPGADAEYARACVAEAALQKSAGGT